MNLMDGRMPRRKESLLEAIMLLPWFAGLAIALLIYILMSRVAPPLLAESTLTRPLGEVFTLLAPWLAGLVALAAMLSLIRSLADQALFRRNRDIETIRHLSWREFERFMGEAFRRDGYLTIETPRGADGGVDLRLRKDRQRFLVQCKHWKSRRIGVKVVRELHGIIAAENADGGFIVTSGRFTGDAHDFAAATRIELIDGEALVSMITRARESVEKERIRHSTVADGHVLHSPPCPRCGRPMIKRLAVKGSFAGEYFWGCSEFPSCRGTINIH